MLRMKLIKLIGIGKKTKEKTNFNQLGVFSKEPFPFKKGANFKKLIPKLILVKGKIPKGLNFKENWGQGPLTNLLALRFLFFWNWNWKRNWFQKKQN